MLAKTEFDRILCKAHMQHHLTNPFGYRSENVQGHYPHYFSEEAFRSFLQEMEEHYPDAFSRYRSGKGSELLERTEKGRTMPPKMASAASSSRFCYLSLRDGAHVLGGGKVTFEADCPVDGVRGTAPQMDAFSAEGAIFIEVKCHEIFDPHAISLSHQYRHWLCGKSNGFLLDIPESTPGEQIHIPLSAFNIGERCMLDIKQLLCHLMGIASHACTSATLVYLFFKPLCADPYDQAQIDALFDALSEDIRKVFTSAPIARFCSANKIKLQAVAQNAPVMQALRTDNLISLF